jgi:cytochrome c biogenesis factor
MLIFHLTSYRRVAVWGAPGGVVPVPARLAAAGSLLLWAAIITAGRLIAYFA